MIHEIVDMDTQEKIRYVSESSNTSGYSTMSPGPNFQRNGNTSPGSVFSMPPSPAHSPATNALQAEFSNLNLPSTNSPQAHYAPMPQQQQNFYVNYINFSNNTTAAASNNMQHQQQFMAQSQQQLPQQFANIPIGNMMGTTAQQPSYKAELRILEQPVEKFRFRYKSEMHGTHGSLNGANSKRTPKTYPEVELKNFPGRAIIRCSLFQANLESPHSHQLVVRKDEQDICDPHTLEVSPESGFVAQFQNMGIIHTAKKFIYEELLRKKRARLCFELGREDITTKELKELHAQTEKEAKDMNLNQVRLCFEAFKVEDNNTWSRIAKPVYSHPINNRKSAQTGELRITRLSIATGSVTGGDDLILLVEKVSKKNIKVRFFEEDEDGGEVWEAFGNFRESDVHHQYAIVCRTPPYRNKDIDKPVEVNIELVRPSDDERSFPPVTFRYKPREQIASRKRRRTNSSATSSSGSGSSLNSLELPKTVQEQQTMNQQQQQFAIPEAMIGDFAQGGQTISEEFRNKILQNEYFKDVVDLHSEELSKMCAGSFSDSLLNILEDVGQLEKDGGSGGAAAANSTNDARKLLLLNKVVTTTSLSTIQAMKNDYLQRIFKIYDEATRSGAKLSNAQFLKCATEVSDLYMEHAEKNENGDTIIHEIIISDNAKVGIKLCHIIKFFELHDLLNRVLNTNNESGLHCACLYDRASYIRPLLGLNCDPTIQDRQGNTALHIAVREQHNTCVESFLNVTGLRLNLTQLNDEGETALHLAIRHNCHDLAKKLLAHDPAAALIPKSKDGNNALHMAVYQQHIKLVQMILNTTTDKSALLASRNTAGQTAYDLARMLNTESGNEMLKLLGNDMKAAGISIIKEEQTSSSSNEDDDIEEEQAMNLKKEEEIVCHEETIAFEPEAEFEIKIKEISKRLLDILKNDYKFEKLSKILNEGEKWKKVARKANLHYLLCVHQTAEQLLNHIKKYLRSQDYENFVKGIYEVDKDAFEVLLTT